MLKKSLIISILIVLAYGFWIKPETQAIAVGVTMFLVGMMFLELGFNTFSGGTLEKILKKSTDKTWKSISFGVLSTTVMQSSSLVSILTISFIGSGLITLAPAIGIIFGANIGTTTGAWLVAGFGLKVKISAFAYPMIIFGGIGQFFIGNRTAKGLGLIVLGLGFLFLGIDYMKDGFEVFKSAIDLTQYAETGVYGLLLFTMLGIGATVIMQSSHATMALIIVALASQQITYENAIALAIGANIGTTITAILGAINSNIEGKRLAGAHLIFNLTTGAIALLGIQYLMIVVDWTSSVVGIPDDEYALKLAVFHTYFNVIGVIVMIPFIDKLVNFLEGFLKSKKVESHLVDTAKYLNESALEMNITAKAVIIKETKDLYQNAFAIIAHGLNLNRRDIVSTMDFDDVVKKTYSGDFINIDDFYKRKIKGIYGEIVNFATRAQSNMSSDDIKVIYNLKLAIRDITEAVKDTKHLQKNMIKYLGSDNEIIREEYINIKKSIAELLRFIDLIIKSTEEAEIGTLLSKARLHIKKNDVIKNGRLNELVNNNLVSHEMFTSLMNDMGYVNDISKNLLKMTKMIFPTDISEELLLNDEDMDLMIKGESNENK